MGGATAHFMHDCNVLFLTTGVSGIKVNWRYVLTVVIMDASAPSGAAHPREAA